MREVDRRQALAAIGAVVLAACGGSKPLAEAPRPPPPVPLHTSPVTGLVAAAGLVWLVDARARAIATPELIPALEQVLPSARLDAFAQGHGGVDLRQLPELAIASYPSALLFVARGLFDPKRLEEAFTARADAVDGRAVDTASAPDGRPLQPITRIFGTVRGAREQLAILGRDAVALEHGRFGPLRAAEAFAQSKLKRARPALETEPLAAAARLLGEAPFRGFAPGPFEGEWAGGLGGLMRAATALGVSARPAPAPPGKSRLDVSVLLTGAWGADNAAAAARLSAAVDQIAQDPLGKLLGLNRPLDGPRARGGDDFVAIDVALDPLELARGLRAATEASVREIMSY